MPNSTIHKVLVTTGCLLWCVSFLGEALAYQPYSTVGLVLSPLLTVIGIVFWLKYYRATKGHNPDVFAAFDSIPHFGKNFMTGFQILSDNRLEFWTIIILVWMLLSAAIFLPFRSSDIFKATKEYCETNEAVLSRTGTIKYYGLLAGGDTSIGDEQGDADITFTIVGTKGNFSANSKLTMQNGKWTVDKLEFR